MRFLPFLTIGCQIASLCLFNNATAEGLHYPIPPINPITVGSENFRSRYLSLGNLKGIYVNFKAIHESTREFGIEIPEELNEAARLKIESSGLSYLKEEELTDTPGQPQMNLWPHVKEEFTHTGHDSTHQDGGETLATRFCRTSLWAEFEQAATIMRQPENQFKLSTWGGGDETYDCTNRGRWIADSILRQIDNFIADYNRASIELKDIIRAEQKDHVPVCSESRITHMNVFGSGETEINGTMERILDELLQVATTCSTFTYIIETHADQRSNKDHNLKITEFRAKSISDYLISNGMEHHRIHMRPLGESAPITTGKSPDDHAKNRRVVIIPIPLKAIAHSAHISR